MGLYYERQLEAKIGRQKEEITRLLADNAELKKGREAIRDNAFEAGLIRGQEEAWELARKIVCSPGYSGSELKEIFGNQGISWCISSNTYSEAAAKIAEWERKKEEICVGDVVTDGNRESAVVTFINDIGTVFYIWNRGVTRQLEMEKFKKLFTKTGRHIDVDAWLAQIGGGSDETEN